MKSHCMKMKENDCAWKWNLMTVHVNQWNGCTWKWNEMTVHENEMKWLHENETKWLCIKMKLNNCE